MGDFSHSRSLFYRSSIRKINNPRTIYHCKPDSGDSIVKMNKKEKKSDISAQRSKLFRFWRSIELGTTARRACPAPVIICFFYRFRGFIFSNNIAVFQVFRFRDSYTRRPSACRAIMYTASTPRKTTNTGALAVIKTLSGRVYNTHTVIYICIIHAAFGGGR